MSSRQRVPVLAAVVALALTSALSLPVGAADILGLTAGPVSVDGVSVPDGTTLIGPALVESGDRSAVLHLSDGRSVALRPESSAFLERGEDGTIALAVRSGSAIFDDDEARPETPTAVGTGEAVELVRLCRYDEAEDDWVLVEVPTDEVEDLLAAGHVYAGEDNNVYDLDDDCDEAAAAIFWTAGKQGLVALGSSLGLVWAIDEGASGVQVASP